MQLHIIKVKSTHYDMQAHHYKMHSMQTYMVLLALFCVAVFHLPTGTGTALGAPTGACTWQTSWYIVGTRLFFVMPKPFSGIFGNAPDMNWTNIFRCSDNASLFVRQTYLTKQLITPAVT